MLCSPARKIRLTSGSTPHTWTSVMQTIAPRPRGQPDVRLGDDVQLHQQRVQQAVVRVEHAAPEHAGDHRGQRPGQDQHGQHEAAAAEHPVQRDRHEDAQHQLQRDRQHHVLQRVRASRRATTGSLSTSLVVAQADVARLLAEQEAARLDALLEPVHHRVEHQHDDQDIAGATNSQPRIWLAGGRRRPAGSGVGTTSCATVALSESCVERVRHAHVALDRRVQQALRVGAELRVPDRRACPGTAGRRGAARPRRRRRPGAGRCRPAA